MGLKPPHQVVTKPFIAQRFAKAEISYDQYATAQQQICQQLLVLLQQQPQRQFNRILEIGCGTGKLTRSLFNTIQAQQWVVNDLYPSQFIQQFCQQSSCTFIQGDAEQWLFDGDFDLVASASTIQWFEHPQTFLQQVANRLKYKGIFLFSTFSPENLLEIRQLTGIGLNYPSLQQWQQWLNNDFDIIKLEQQQIKLTFPSALAVLKHLKYTGVTAIRQENWNKQKLINFCQTYQQRFATTKQQVVLTYTPIYCLAIKK